jgi:(p)ppGpp synthase/HD superfamily hydrolase
MTLGTSFSEALVYACQLHKGQKRKGTSIPYISHLLGVCDIVLTAGGNETEAIAALLHDGPEDCGGKPVLDEIRAKFRDDVASIVEGCSDSLVNTAAEEKAPWRDRKEAYIELLHDEPAPVLLVSATSSRTASQPSSASTASARARCGIIASWSTPIAPLPTTLAENRSFGSLPRLWDA